MPASNDSIACALVGLHKPWYGGAFGPQRLAPSGAQKVAKSKRDVDGGRQGRRPAQLSGPDAEPKPWLLYRTEVCGTVQGVAALSIVDPTLGESDRARAHIPSG